MRKLFTLLVVAVVASLVIGSSTVVYAGPEEASANTSFGVGGNLSLKITDGNSVWFGKSLEPGKEHTQEDATTLTVETNMSIEWEISTSKSVLARPSTSGILDTGFSDETVKNELTVSLSDKTGTGETTGIKASYSLEDLKYGSDNAWEFPSGFYKIQVTYTVAAS